MPRRSAPCSGDHAPGQPKLERRQPLAGQLRFTDKGDNRWRPATRDSRCWPYSASGCGKTLVIADSGNLRVLLWEAAP